MLNSTKEPGNKNYTLFLCRIPQFYLANTTLEEAFTLHTEIIHQGSERAWPKVKPSQNCQTASAKGVQVVKTRSGGNNKMSFSLYFFHVRKDMITHRQAAHQSAEMGHEQQEPDSIREARACKLKPLLSYIHGIRDGSCSSLSLTSVHLGVFSTEEQKQLCNGSSASSDECRIHPQEVLKVVQGMLRSCWSSLMCTGSSTGGESTALCSLTSLPIREAKLPISDYFPTLSRTQNSSSSICNHVPLIIIC